MFGLLVDDSLVDIIPRDCEQLRDPWSASLVSTYVGSTGGLRNETLVAERLATARMLRRETAQVESNHASIRRALRLNSVQTHGVLFQHMSAQRTLQQVRKLSQHLRPGYCKPDEAS